jgi:broad specificity phosphatase PhoE
MSKRIYIVRHGQTDLNKEGIVQGSGVDAALNDTGWAQAEAFHKYYHHMDFDVVITSTLLRTRQTMEPFIRYGLPWEQFTEINEMAWGVHEGKRSTPTMRAQYREMINAWKSGNYHARLEEGESAFELQQRITSFVDHLKDRTEQTILVCSHGRAMRCLMTVLQQEPLFEMERYQHSNTGLWIADYANGSFNLNLENDTRHLEGVTLPQ